MKLKMKISILIQFKILMVDEILELLCELISKKTLGERTGEKLRHFIVSSGDYPVKAGLSLGQTFHTFCEYFSFGFFRDADHLQLLIDRLTQIKRSLNKDQVWYHSNNDSSSARHQSGAASEDGTSSNGHRRMLESQLLH